MESPRRSFIQRNRLPLIFVMLGAAVLIASIVFALSARQAQTVDFTLETLDGGGISGAGVRGKVVVLNFWASWCVPCREEMPLLADYYRQHANENFMLIAVNVGEDAETARDFMVEFEVDFPVGLDPDAALADQLGIGGLPVTLILDSNGKLAYRHAGIISEAVLDAQVQAASGD